MIYLGPYQTALAHVTTCDAVICDPPYGARTHDGQDARRFDSEYLPGGIPYAHWTPDDVRKFVASWSPRVRGWMACMTSDDLIPVYRDAYAAAGRYDFAPVPILQHRVRVGGDGPGSGAVYLMVARPREARFAQWGSLPCWYTASLANDGYAGAKPLGLMRQIVRDYSRPGDIVVDPTAGTGTTVIAAIGAGRVGIGAEQIAETYELARRRISDAGFGADGVEAARAKQAKLF
jgi:site-specific DNA-methyltransferase (adenine-specific)